MQHAIWYMWHETCTPDMWMDRWVMASVEWKRTNANFDMRHETLYMRDETISEIIVSASRPLALSYNQSAKRQKNCPIQPTSKLDTEGYPLSKSALLHEIFWGRWPPDLPWKIIHNSAPREPAGVVGVCIGMYGPAWTSIQSWPDLRNLKKTVFEDFVIQCRSIKLY